MAKIKSIAAAVLLAILSLSTGFAEAPAPGGTAVAQNGVAVAGFDGR